MGAEMWRSVGAVVGGYLGMTVLVIIGTLAITAALMPEGLANMAQPPPGQVLSPMYLSANLLLGFVAAVVGGWLAARIAPAAPFKHLAVLGGLMTLMAVVTIAT